MKNIFTTLLVGLALFSIPAYTFSQTTNLISFNIKYDNTSDTINSWNKRRASLATLIKHYDADIIGIQEGLHRQVDYLNNALDGYTYVGVGRDDGQQKGEYSAIFYNSNKFKVLKTNTFWLSETPEKVSVGWDASMERICTYALFLNLTPDTEPIQFLKKNLTDAMEISQKPFYGPIGSFNGFDQDRIMENRIDYIFVNKIDVLSYTHIDDRMPNNMHISDHLPVLMTMKD